MSAVKTKAQAREPSPEECFCFCKTRVYQPSFKATHTCQCLCLHSRCLLRWSIGLRTFWCFLWASNAAAKAKCGHVFFIYRMIPRVDLAILSVHAQQPIEGASTTILCAENVNFRSFRLNSRPFVELHAKKNSSTFSLFPANSRTRMYVQMPTQTPPMST